MRMIALIRGINVGKAKRVAMADLRAMMSALGYQDVKTLLNSGNLVFTSSEPPSTDVAARIEAAMRDRLGVSARVMVLTAGELDQIVRENPLKERAVDPSRFLVAVLSPDADRSRLQPLLNQEWSPEAMALGEKVAYLWCPDGILASRVAPALGKALGDPDAVTSRNWSTMLKLHGLIRESP